MPGVGAPPGPGPPGPGRRTAGDCAGSAGAGAGAESRAAGVPVVRAPGSGPGAAGAVRRVRRCTAGAVVRVGGRGGLGGTGRTRGPGGPPDGGASVGGGSGRAIGRVSEGAPRPGDGLPDVLRAPRIRPPGAASSTACDSVPVKDGFCQVVSEPPNAGSATPRGGRAAAVDRIGGSPAHASAARRSVRSPAEADAEADPDRPSGIPTADAGRASGRASSPGARPDVSPGASAAAPPRGARDWPRSLSSNPIYPSVARVTREAISRA